MEKLVGHPLICVDYVVEDGLGVADDFRLPVRQHWDRRIRVLVYVGLLKVFFVQRVDLDELDVVSTCHVSDSKQCSSVLTEVVTPNFQLIRVRSNVI